MTAPLPPLPYWMVHTLSAAEQADVAAYAKLAVRQVLERAANEAEHWQKISTTPGHACGQYIAQVIRAMIEEYTK